jgi:hypothetical protein
MPAPIASDNPQPVQREQRDQRSIEGAGETGGDEHRTDLVAIEPGRVGLVIERRSPTPNIGSGILTRQPTHAIFDPRFQDGGMPVLRSMIRKSVAACVALGIAATGLLVVPQTASADTTGWLTADYRWTANSANLHAWGQSYYRNYGCGLKDCAYSSNVDFQAGKLSGSGSPNLTRVSAKIRFGGVGIEVSVSWPPAAGFTDAGSSCDHGWWDGSATWVAVDLGSQRVCESSTWGWISNMDIASTGGSRFGSTWSVRTASRTVSLGGL